MAQIRSFFGVERELHRYTLRLQKKVKALKDASKRILGKELSGLKSQLERAEASQV